MEILTIVAIIVGPIAAVLITRFLDRRNERKRRQNEILTSLMRTRATRLSAEHVGALNIIQLEFHEKEPIITAYQNYIEHLSVPLPPVDEQDHFLEQREGLFLILISEIAKHLILSTKETSVVFRILQRAGTIKKRSKSKTLLCLQSCWQANGLCPSP